MSSISACVLLALLGGFPVVAQKKSGTSRQWFTRAESLTASIIVDTVGLATYDRAMLFGRLAEAWWKDDPERARTWMKKAIEVLDHADAADVSARRHKLSTARALLAIVAPRDRTLSGRLAKMFVTDSDKTPDAERQQNAEALLDAALAVVNADPERAANLGAASLRNGPTRQLIDLLWRLSARDSRLGAALFSQALMLASASSDASLFGQLAQMAFANGQSASVNPIPIEARTQLLASLAQQFLSRPVEPGMEANCTLTWIVAPLMGQYDQLLPQQTPPLRQALSRCHPTLDSLARERVNESATETPLKSVDDFLQAADRVGDPKVRVFHLARAAFLAGQQRDYDRAIRILESIGSDERKLMNGAWERARAEWAARSAVVHAESGDYATMRKVIADTPSDLRPLTFIDVAEKLADAGDLVVATELAYEAQQTLEKATVSRLQRVNTQIILVHLFAKLAPSETPRTLQEMVTAMNRIKKSEEPDAESLEGDLDDVLLQPIGLPVSLLETDGLGVQQSVSSIQQSRERVRVRLGLLNATLEKIRTASPVKKQASVVDDGNREVKP